MVRPVLLILAAVLSIALYRMFSRGGKTYSYTRTKTISVGDDGTERVVQASESGTIVVTNKTVIIDGVEYVYKPFGDDPLQAIVEFEHNSLGCVRVLLPDGEKQFLIEKAHTSRSSIKSSNNITATLACVVL